MSLTKATYSMIKGASLNIVDFGAVGDGVTDDTAAIQAAVDAAFANGNASVYVPPGTFIVNGTVTMKIGVVLYGDNPVGEYYPSQPGVRGAMLYKPDTGSAQAGPIVEMCDSSALYGLAFKHLKVGGATTGVVRFGPLATATNLTYAAMINCYLIGINTGDLSGTTTHRGIFFPASQSGNARYFNRISNCTLTYFDIGIGLQSQCNANNFSNIITRDCHRHYELNGSSSECIENTFTGLGLFSIPVMTPTPVGFTLQPNVKNNNFISYNTEMYGIAYSIDATAVGNRFLGQTNEAQPSFVPPETNTDFNYAIAINNSQNDAMLLPTRTTGDRFIFGEGVKAKRFARCTGTLPELNNNAGTLVANDADNRIIARFNPAFFSKANKPTFRGTLRIYGDGPFGVGCVFTEVNFIYSTVESTTPIGQFKVISYTQNSNRISGLYFITSVSSPANGFAIALVGGNYGAYAFDSLTVSLEIDAVALTGEAKQFSQFYDVSFATEAVTAADVTDGITMLTVGDTTV